MTGKRAVIYLRVSTTEQTEKSQLEPCKKFCENKGYEIIAVKSDKKSAYKAIVRQGYNDVIDMVKHSRVDHIVVWSLDRWTRRGHIELRSTIRYLEKYHVQLHSVKEKWIDEITGGDLTFMRDIILDLLGWLAQQESKQKSERVKSSLKFQKAMEKKTVGRPNVINQVENEVLEYLGNGKSYRWIIGHVTYKAKNGKIRNLSIASVSHIANAERKEGKI